MSVDTLAPANPTHLGATADPASSLAGGAPGVPPTVADDLVVPAADGLVTYAPLDHAASTPALRAVKDAVDRALLTYSSVHRGNGYASRVTSRWYEQARAEVADFVGAREGDLVVFTRSTTDSWSLLAAALPADTTVFVFATEHHSTLLPWGAERTVTLEVPASPAEALGRLEAALAATTTAHRLIVVTGASNVTGEVWPLSALVAVAARYGARIALDAAQLAPHRPIDLAAWGVDYVAFSGHKLYAPFGAGVLAGRADWLDAADPYLAGGGATIQVDAHRAGNRTHATASWATGAPRHEGGSPNVIGAIALAAACATLRAHWADVQAHEQALSDRLREALAEIDGVRVLGLFDDVDHVGVVPFTVAGLDSAEVSTALSFRYGIGVRDGRFCAHLFVDHLLDGDPHTTAVRASIGLATTAAHVERLIAALTEITASVRSGTWTTPLDPQAELDAVRPW